MLEVIVCDDIESFEKRYKEVKGKRDILCLTKNVEVFLKCSELYEDVEVEFLESPKNGWDYEEQVWNILDEVNACISQVITDRPYIYHANYKLEGTTEAAQLLDMLMLYDIFDDFLLKNKEVCVYCCYNVVYSKEIEQLYFWCKKNKQKFFLDLGRTKWEFLKLRLFVLSVFGEKALELVMEFHAAIQRTAKISNLKKQIKVWDKFEKEKISTEIGIVRQSGRAKDYNWAKAYLDDLQAANIKFRFICMNEDVKKQWEKYGYEADNIERSLQLGILNRELKNYKRIKKKLWKSLKIFLADHQTLTDTLHLRMIMLSHLCYGVFECVISDTAANEFFKTHDYKIIDLHVSTNSLSSKVCEFNAKKHNQRVKIKSSTGPFPLFRTFDVYEPYGHFIDFRFVTENVIFKHGQRGKDGTKSADRKYVVRSAIYSDAFFNNSFTDDSLAKELQVLWAPSYPTTYTNTYSHFIKTGLLLFDFFSESNGYLKIKFHPNQKTTEIKIFEEKCHGKRNIVIEPAEINIQNILKKVDIMIANSSTSIMDAVVERKAVISVAFGREYNRIEQHKDGICIIRDYKELTGLLKRLSEDEEYRKKWIEERVKVQEQYFSKLMADAEESKMIIDIIKQELDSCMEK